tara:strand:- start:1163 stop:1411 length:249 start_codon:yes stop_codon:yes gene_type:complete
MSDLNKLNLTKVIEGQITREFFLNQNLRDKYERLMENENKKNLDKYDNGFSLYYEKRIKELLSFMKIAPEIECFPDRYFRSE